MKNEIERDVLSDVIVEPYFFDIPDSQLDNPFLHSHDRPTVTYADAIALGAKVLAEVTCRRGLIFIEGDNKPATLAIYLAALRARHVVHMINRYDEENCQALVALYQPNAIVRCVDGEPSVEIIHNLQLDLHPDLAILLSTSGSTGSSKLVKISYNNIEANTRSIVEYLTLRKNDIGVTLLKPHYSYGMSVINTHIAVGASLLVTDSSVQDPNFWDQVAANRVTNLAGVPHIYEMLDKLTPDWSRLGALRLMTQAGGRLPHRLVRQFANLGAKNGWDFVVMYGQTEAAPRMAYLPAHLAAAHPESIGQAIPGGKLMLRDIDGFLVEGAGVEGEIVYSGPNVMMGYAANLDELSTTEQIGELRTGDLAIRDDNGLFYITGRKARFTKLFGLRISLDDVQSHLDTLGCIGAVVESDSGIIAFVEGAPDTADITNKLAERYRLPASVIHCQQIDELPRLASGKIDYKSLSGINLASGRSKGAIRDIIFELWREFLAILTGRTAEPISVRAAFLDVIPDTDIEDTDSFLELGGDSTSFIELSLLLESYLGYLPMEWQTQTVVELEQLKRDADV